MSFTAPPDRLVNGKLGRQNIQCVSKFITLLLGLAWWLPHVLIHLWKVRVDKTVIFWLSILYFLFHLHVCNTALGFSKHKASNIGCTNFFTAFFLQAKLFSFAGDFLVSFCTNVLILNSDRALLDIAFVAFLLSIGYLIVDLSSRIALSVEFQKLLQNFIKPVASELF